MLNAEQFVLAMYLLQQKVKGVEVPKSLTPEMIPPSMRGSITPSATSTEDKVKLIIYHYHHRHHPHHHHHPHHLHHPYHCNQSHV
jgi:hypothetical protein